MMKLVDKYQFKQLQTDPRPTCALLAAVDIKNNQKVTLKRLSRKNAQDHRLIAHCLKEVQMLKKIESQHIIRCHKVLKTSKNIYIVYDDMEAQKLSQAELPDLSLPKKIKIALQLCSALKILHTQKISHNKITPENIIFCNETVKLINFDSAEQLSNNEYASGATLKNTLSQSLENTKKNNNVYQLGNVLIFVFSKEFQFYKQKEQKLVKHRGHEDNFEAGEISKIFNFVKTMMNAKTHSYLYPDTIFDFFCKIKQELDDHSTNDSPCKSQRINDVFAPISFKKTTMSMQERQFSFEKRPKTEDQICDDIIRVVIKQRNFTILLNKLACCILSIGLQLEDGYSWKLAFQLMIKSKKVMAEICRLMQTGNSNFRRLTGKELELLKEYRKYTNLIQTFNSEKTSINEKIEFIKMAAKFEFSEQETISNEMINSQVRLFVQLLKTELAIFNSSLHQQTKPNLKEISKDRLVEICCLCLVSQFSNLEQAFQSLFSSSGDQLQNDIFVHSLKHMSEQQLIRLVHTFQL